MLNNKIIFATYKVKIKFKRKHLFVYKQLVCKAVYVLSWLKHVAIHYKIWNHSLSIFRLAGECLQYGSVYTPTNELRLKAIIFSLFLRRTYTDALHNS